MGQAGKGVLQDAAILKMVMLHGLPVALIATALGSSRQAVYRTIERAKYQMKRQEWQKLRAAIKAAQTLRASRGQPPLETARLTPKKPPKTVVTTRSKRPAAKMARRPHKSRTNPGRSQPRQATESQQTFNQEEQQ